MVMNTDRYGSQRTGTAIAPYRDEAPGPVKGVGPALQGPGRSDPPEQRRQR
jgi:hypothetical protein